jgi:hypothetical protein
MRLFGRRRSPDYQRMSGAELNNYLREFLAQLRADSPFMFWLGADG